MQNPIPHNDSRPIAKRVKKQTTNLGKRSDQLKIHKAVYQNYLCNELQLATRVSDQLIRLYDKLIDSETMETTFNLRIEIFHSAFIQKLRNL